MSSVPPKPYVQRLAALELSLERYTADVPQDGAYYLLRAGEQVGRYRSLKGAQEAWEQAKADAGYEPPRREIDPKAALARQNAERWSRNRAG